MKQKAFTLAEVLISIAILTVMGIILTEVFFKSLRGGNRAEILAKIKQNGQAVLETMDKAVRNSDEVICAFPDTLVVFKEGIYTRYVFSSPIFSGNLKRNGFISQDNLSDCTAPTPTGSNLLILTDTNLKSGVSVKKVEFKRSKKPGFKDVVTVKMEFVPGVDTPATISQEIDPVGFTTTLELR